jgi:hypothetical protein
MQIGKHGLLLIVVQFGTQINGIISLIDSYTLGEVGHELWDCLMGSHDIL